eukprot:6210605-Pleurochrysis_carterae.AAC.2
MIQCGNALPQDRRVNCINGVEAHYIVFFVCAYRAIPVRTWRCFTTINVESMNEPFVSVKRVYGSNKLPCLAFASKTGDLLLKHFDGV